MVMKSGDAVRHQVHECASAGRREALTCTAKGRARTLYGSAAMVLAAFCLVLAGCGMTQVKGWLGVTWGEDAAAAASRLGIACGKWLAWDGRQGYERCTDLDRHAVIYGVMGRPEVIRRAGRVEGIMAVFRDCAEYGRLRDGLAAEFRLEKRSGDLYRSGRNGEVVRLFRDRRDGTCVIVVTGAGFGKAYSEFILRRGIDDLGGAMRPR